MLWQNTIDDNDFSRSNFQNQKYFYYFWNEKSVLFRIKFLYFVWYKNHSNLLDGTSIYIQLDFAHRQIRNWMIAHSCDSWLYCNVSMEFWCLQSFPEKRDPITWIEKTNRQNLKLISKFFWNQAYQETPATSISLAC